MIDFLPYLKIAPIFLIALAVPGPDFLFVSTTALQSGRGAGLRGAAGIATGLLFYCAISLWGLGVVLNQMAGLVHLIRICGGLYLLYLGTQLWRASLTPALETPDLPTAPQKLGKRRPFVSGILTNLTNPKAIAFFASIFALAIDANTNNETRILTTFLCALTAFVWFAFVALTLSAPRVRQSYLGIRKYIDRVAGSLLLLFGAKLVFSEK